MAELQLVDRAWAKNILVFAPNDSRPGQSLAVRVFADYYGIVEDSATGSGSGALAAYLAHTHYFGKRAVDIAVGQGYEMGRPSQLHLRTAVEDGRVAVFVGGRVIEIAEGLWCR